MTSDTPGMRRLDEDALLGMVRKEFLEMPGLCLTSCQASRLWNVEAKLVDHVVETLVQDGFLGVDEEGRLRRRMPVASRRSAA